MKRKFTCHHCKNTSAKETGHVNRSLRKNAPLYCSRACFGLARRKHQTKAQLIEKKRLYDIEYRRKNHAKLKAAKRIYFKKTYDPVKAAEIRKKRMPWHLQYCRRPEYRTWKRAYDRKYNAKKNYGDLADVHLLVMDIRDEALKQASRYELDYANGRIGKSQNRKRDYERTHSQKSEIGALGNIGPAQR